MKTLQGATKMAFLGFFISHIPITICLDTQAVLSWHPQFLKDLLAWYCEFSGDFLMTAPFDPWFQSLIWAEHCCQLPFFVVASKMILLLGKGEAEAEAEADSHYPAWFKSACIMYGAHVTTTLVPILGSFWTSPDMTDFQRVLTISFYLPYLIFPFWIMCLAVSEDFSTASASFSSPSSLKKKD